jgi:hypothetical protein
MIVVLCQSAELSVVEATYLGSVLSPLATGSSGSVTFGQKAAKMSYVRRPSRNASALSNTSIMNRPVSSSKCGTSQPPRSNPPLRSSSGPPGPCMTPSTDRNVVSVTCIIVLPLRFVPTDVWSRYLLNTPAPAPG